MVMQWSAFQSSKLTTRVRLPSKARNDDGHCHSTGSSIRRRFPGVGIIGQHTSNSCSACNGNNKLTPARWRTQAATGPGCNPGASASQVRVLPPPQGTGCQTMVPLAQENSRPTRVDWPRGLRRRPAKAVGDRSSPRGFESRINRRTPPGTPVPQSSTGLKNRSGIGHGPSKTFAPFAAGRSVPPPVRPVRECPSDGKAIHRVRLPAFHTGRVNAARTRPRTCHRVRDR